MASNLNHIITMTEAVQTLEPPAHRYKRGDVREDGLIFWAYTQHGKYQEWVSEKRFLDRKTKRKEYRHKYYKNNKETEIQGHKKYYAINRTNIIQGMKEYYVRDRDKRLSDGKQYREKNKCEINRRNVIYCKNRLKTDVLYRLSRSVGSLIRIALLSQKYTKKSRTHEILGCSFEFFKNYIEQRFLDGMTWENRSEWHLDHIIPVSSGKTEKEIIKLNHYTNFRPLWAKENIVKGNKQNKQLELIK